MRAPPEKQTPPNLARRGGAAKVSVEIRKPLLKPILPLSQEPTFTAVPRGTDWQVKCLSPGGDVALFGKFDGRLPALGAAVLMAAHAEGRVCP